MQYVVCIFTGFFSVAFDLRPANTGSNIYVDNNNLPNIPDNTVT